MKKICLFCFVLFFIQITLFSQEQTNKAQNKLGNLFITSGLLYQHNADGITSAPSPLYFNIGFGGRIPFASHFSFAPFGQGFAGYYLWANETALPSSPENRTVYTPNLLIDLPILFELPVKESVFSVGLGISVLVRYGFLTNGVSEDDYDDVPLINGWYWQNCRFIYPSAQLSWDFMLPNGTAIGLGVKGYLPLGNYFTQNPISYFQDGLISVSARFFFKPWQAKKKPVDSQPTEVDNLQTQTGIDTQE